MQCPHCSQELDLSSVAVGSSVTCPICGGRFVFGARPSPPSLPSAQSAQPFQQAAPSAWHVLAPDGQKFGPVAESEVITWIQEGRIGADGRVWRTGMSDWAFIESTPPFAAYCPARTETQWTGSTHRFGIRCPLCGHEGRPIVTKKLSSGGWVLFVVLLLFCLVLCWLPFVIDACKDEERRCAACGSRIG